MEKDALINFADLDGRERLEFEVSQLADGTLRADRREFIQAAVARDASLRALLDDFRRIDATLSRQPDWSTVNLGRLEADVMRLVRDNDEPAGAMRIGTASSAVTADRAWWSNPWTSAAAAAAALVIGLGIGTMVMHEPGPGTLQIVVPSEQAGGAVADGSLEILGPGDRLAGTAGPTDTLASGPVLSVSGPDVSAALDPNVQSTFPDLVAIYSGASNVIDRQSRVVIASVDGSSETE